MPFAYMGAKHGLARYYPAPAFDTIVEPFAGSAGYSVFWATEAHRVVLFDSDPRVVRLWRDLQSDSARAILDDAEEQLRTRDHITNPFAYMAGCGLYRVREGGAAAKTSLMVQMWPGVRRRIEAALPLIRNWEIHCCEYDRVHLDDRPRTVFVDAPYQDARSGKSGNRYGHKSHAIDYNVLAQWCRAVRGQAIVCEQGDADWLPFKPLRSQRTRIRRGDTQPRLEKVWTNGVVATDAQGQLAVAAARRWARMKPRPGGPRGPYRKRTSVD